MVNSTLSDCRLCQLYGLRKPGYWTPAVRERQAAEAARRTTTPSVLAVNMAMLENLSLQDGQCFVTVRELAKLVGCTERSVQAARRELIGVGLWVAGNGVYVPVPFERVN